MHPVAAVMPSDLSVAPPAASRLRRALRWLGAPLKPFYIIVFPDRMRPEIVAGRYGVPLLAVVLCACVAAFALGARLDVGPAVRAEDTARDAKVEIKTDREIAEAIAKRTAVARVKLGMNAALATPLRVLALAFALLLLARFIGGKPTTPRVLTVASLAAVPGAVRSLLTAIVAWRQPRVFPDELDTFVAFPDVFLAWSIVLVAIGLAPAAEIKPRKSIAAVAVASVLYLTVTRIILGAPQ